MAAIWEHLVATEQIYPITIIGFVIIASIAMVKLIRAEKASRND